MNMFLLDDSRRWAVGVGVPGGVKDVAQLRQHTTERRFLAGNVLNFRIEGLGLLRSELKFGICRITCRCLPSTLVCGDWGFGGLGVLARVPVD